MCFNIMYFWLIISPLLIPTTYAQTNSSNSLFAVGDTTNRFPRRELFFILFSDTKNFTVYQEIILDDVKSLKAANLVPGKVTIICQPFGVQLGAEIFLKNAYLKQGIRNIIIMGYPDLVVQAVEHPVWAFLNYPQTLKNVPTIVTTGAAFISFLYKNGKITNAGQIHLIGWSLAAHLVSGIGFETRRRYGLKVGRVTGLDVTDILFTERFLKNYRFRRNSALFVEAIHTGIGGIGSSDRLGHADFYINGGKIQRQVGCDGRDYVRTAVCAHSTSVGFYAKSIDQNYPFIGCSCAPAPRKTKKVPRISFCDEEEGECRNRVIAGEYCPPGTRGKFFVRNKIPLSLNTSVQIQPLSLS